MDQVLNRTGMKTSPEEASLSAQGAIELTQVSGGDASAIAENRIFYMREADPVGTIPEPNKDNALPERSQDKVINLSPVFIDKLGERLAFERSGTRLYEVLISKYNGSEDRDNLPILSQLEQFYLEEMKHFQLVSDAITKIGGDPTAITPAADVAGVASAGWVQVLTDPRTSFLQSLEVILQAELVDNVGWELLIELAENNELGDLAIQFQQALDEENIHLSEVKKWVQELTLEGRLLSQEEKTGSGDAIKH